MIDDFMDSKTFFIIISALVVLYNICLILLAKYGKENLVKHDLWIAVSVNSMYVVAIFVRLDIFNLTLP